jgi:uncharacterized FlgJ-related protein
MRTELAPLLRKRRPFTATFARYGKRSGWIPHSTEYRYRQFVTLLFQDVRDQHGKIVADHVWFTDSKAWQRLRLEGEERVAFEARVATYAKRSRDEDLPGIDYKLAYPTHVRRAEAAAEAGPGQALLG